MKNPIEEWTQYAQEKLENKNWFPYKFVRVYGGIVMTGAVCPIKKNGQPDFKKRDKKTEIQIIFPIKE